MEKDSNKEGVVPNGKHSPHEPIKLRISKKALDKSSVSEATKDFKENNLDISSPPENITSPAADENEEGHFSIGKTKTKGKIKELMKMKDKKATQLSADDVEGKNNNGPEADKNSTNHPGNTSMDISSPKANVSLLSSPGTPTDAAVNEEYLVGDLVFGKVSGHPYWPCVVAYDPYLGIYSRNRSNAKFRDYHVEYFGDENERGWVSVPRLIPYKGREAFEAWCNVMKSKNKKDAKQYTINASRRKAWEIAMAAAEKAMTMTQQERKHLFTHRYKVPEVSPPPAPKEKPVTSLTSPPKEKKQKLSLKRKKPEDESKGVTPPPKKRKKADDPVVTYTCETSPSASGELTKIKLISSFLQQTETRPGASEKKSGDPEKKTESAGVKTGDKKQSDKKTDQPEKKKRRSSVKSEKDTDSSAPKKEDKSDVPEETLKVAKVKKSTSVEQDESTQDDRSRESTPSLKDEDGKQKPKREKKGYSNSKWVPPRLPGDSGEIDYELEIFRLTVSSSLKKESICLICELPSEALGDLIQCEGPCHGTYHLSCLGLTVLPAGAFRCDECGSGRHTCFVCKSSGSAARSCSSSHCGRYYHDDCIQKFPLTKMENGNITCPLHTCATCAADNPKGLNVSKGRMFRCVRCPTAYHVGDYCIAAGSIHLAGLHIVCSRHFKPVKTLAHHSHVNVSWCFICSKGGTLLCCESCPAAFHTECLGISPPNDKWYCADCARGKRPLYGDIVWVKVGNYRWWPGEICQPKHVPLNIQNKVHQVGEFPIRFFGSHDYFWTHQARVFHFQEGDKGSKDTASNNSIAKIFHKAVSEATSAFNIWCMAKKIKQEQEQEKNDRKPVPYKHVKANIPIGTVTIYKADPAELPRCECRPDHRNPCGLESECLNRMMLYECHPSTCPAKDACQNQKFTKRDYPESKATKVQGRGWGLEVLVDVKKGAFVNEYVGDLIDEEECRRRIKDAHTNNVTNFYMLTLDKNRIIDAGPKGNLSRFMNHSCQPNCETQKWNVNGDVRVGLFAVRDINAGEELTFNYNLECLGNEKTACQCGSANCSGFLGVRPKILPGNDLDKKLKKKRRRNKQNVQKQHEDDCYRCGDGGDLVMCDKTNCPKVYHLKCLNLGKLPHGKWLCPWHHCDECGKKAVKLCSECPNSFCANHLENNIFKVGEDQLVCSDHSELLNALDMSRVTVLQNDPSLALEEPALTSYNSDTTSESSPSQSDEDDSNGTTLDPPVIPSLPKYTFDCSPNLKPGTITSRNSSSSSDSSEGRLCIVEDDINAELPPQTEKPNKSPPKRKRHSTGEPMKKRGRPKKNSVPSPIPVTDICDVSIESIAKEQKPSGVKKTSKKSQSLDETKNTDKKSSKPQRAKKKSSKLQEAEASESLLDDNDNDFPDLVMDIPVM